MKADEDLYNIETFTHEQLSKAFDNACKVKTRSLTDINGLLDIGFALLTCNSEVSPAPPTGHNVIV